MRTNFISYIIIILFIPFLWKGQEIVAQNVAITDDDSYNADSSAILDVKSLTKGMLVPRMTSAQRLLISNPATGLLVFDTNESSFFFYNGTAWANLSSGGDVWTQTGSNVHLADSSNNVGIGTNTPFGKLEVKADASIGINDPILQVVNNLGDTIFAVYNNGVRINVEDSPAKATGSKGGFAVGGFSPAKAGTTNEYFRVTPDSVRIYIEENNPAKATGSKGGFAVGGFSPAKTIINDYLSVNSDSINVSKSLYIPRMTTVERDNLGFVPSEALIIFNTTDKCMQIYENSVWSNIWCFNCAPAFIIQPVDQTTCSETNANFVVSLTGTNLVYQWQQSTDGGTTWSDISNGGTSPAYSGATSYSLSLVNVPLSFNGYKYRCNVSAACPPGVTSTVVTLNVGSTPPTITTQPTNQQLTGGCTASFNVSSIGFGVTYQWQQSADGGSTWGDIADGGSAPIFSGTTASSISLSNVPLAYDNYKYRCVVRNSCGSDAISNAVTLSVSPAPTISGQPTDKLLATNGTATFTITVSGTGMLYLWQQSTDGGSTWNDITNGGTNPVYSGATTSSVSLTNIPTAFNNYKYRCIVSHFCSPSTTSNAATFNYIPLAFTTTAVSDITSTTATSGGNITSDGGETITDRGVCWSTSTNPDITGNHTTDGIGIGSFTSNLTGLTLGLTYYVRAYVTNNIGTTYGNQVSFYTPTLDIGQSYQGGIIAYILQPGDPGYVTGQTHGLIAAPSDQSTGAEWGCFGTYIGTTWSIGTGSQNTIDIEVGCTSPGTAADICANLVLNGYNDWFLPSGYELDKMYINKTAIGGFSLVNYWSSTETSGSFAWKKDFTDGSGIGKAKTGYFYYVRAIRAF